MAIRRWFLLPMVFGAMTLVVTEGRAPAQPRAAGERPNVLIIVTDDQRARGTFQAMPRTDQWLLGDGVTFTDAYATTPLCCPSRTSIMTGQYAHNHRVRNNFKTRNIDHRDTLQRYLQHHGYITAISGKFLNNWKLEKPPPYFDHYSIFSKGGYRGTEFASEGRTESISRYSTSFIRDEALRFLEEFEADDDQPWYLYVAPFAPHRPALPNRPYVDSPLTGWEPNPSESEIDTSDKPGFVQAAGVPLHRGGVIRARQLRSLISVDLMVDRFREALEELSEGSNTLVIYMSDNGFMWRDHGMIDKRLPYTASVRIPLVMRWPDHLDGGAIDRRLSANIDVAPTVLEAAGIDIDPLRPMDGRSLLQTWDRDALLLEFWSDVHRFWDWYSIRTRDYQYTEYYARGEPDRPMFREYYDLLADRWQLTNLFGDESVTNDPDTTTPALLLDLYRDCEGATCP